MLTPLCGAIFVRAAPEKRASAMLTYGMEHCHLVVFGRVLHKNTGSRNHFPDSLVEFIENFTTHYVIVDMGDFNTCL